MTLLGEWKDSQRSLMKNREEEKKIGNLLALTRRRRKTTTRYINELTITFRIRR